MIRPAASLRRQATLGMAAILTATLALALLVAALVYVYAFRLAMHTQGDTLASYYETKFEETERGWEDAALRSKSRIEFSRILENADGRWLRLKAQLTAESVSPIFSGLAISNGSGAIVFRHGAGPTGPYPAATEAMSEIFQLDAQGRLFHVITQPIWLGPDGMGSLHLLIALDHALLRSQTIPGSELFLAWQGKALAASSGEQALAQFAGPAPEAGLGQARRVEREIKLSPHLAEGPQLLVRASVAAPFSPTDGLLLAAGLFGLQALLLTTALRRWLRRLLARVGALQTATQEFTRSGQPTPALVAALDQGHGKTSDELSEVSDALSALVFQLHQREQEQRRAEGQLRANERRFRDIAESMGELIWESDEWGRFVYLSEKVAEYYGLPMEKLLGASAYATVLDEDRETTVNRIKVAARACVPFKNLEYRIRHSDGSVRWLSSNGTPIYDAHGDCTHAFRGTTEDITQRKQAEEKLLLADKVFAYSSQAIVITDRDNKIVTVNPAFSSITGYDANEVIGKNPKVLASGRHDKAFYAAMWSDINRFGAWAGEVWDRRRNGEIYPKWLDINAVHDTINGQVSHYVATFSDITERKANEERIAQLAYNDPLTSLPNRFSLSVRLEQSLADARRNAGRLAVMFIDLDHFKTINDSLGHAVGDELLIAVAGRIRASLRETDTVARIGGDEFVIVLPGIDGPEDAARIADKLIESVGTPVSIAGHPLHTSPSVGISLYPDDGRNIDTLMKNADTAMYYAKQHGRNNYRFFTTEMNTSATERLQLESQLRHALERQELFLAYQPQVDIASGATIGVEALVRWKHPDRGIIPPLKFIAIAEETGLIVPLGQWVLEEACRQAMAWSAEGLPPLRVAVNLSARQFRDRHLLQQVRDVLTRTGLPPERLELELTESAIMDNPEQGVEVLRNLRALGLHLAIDDFGTGYSSLSYLKRFPIQRLKIDRSFVMDLEHDANDVAIAQAVIALARTLGLGVTAEGIETAAQLEMLRSFGCSEGQGYLFSRPVSAEEMRRFLAPDQRPGATIVQLH